MAEIDYYLFPLSPFSYLAGLELEAIAARQGASIAYKPVQLLRIFAEVGTPQVGGPASVEAEVPPAGHRPAGAGAKGMPINLQPRHWPTNPMPASAAIVSAERAGGGDVGGLVHGFLRAVWAEERDIAEDETVRDGARRGRASTRRSPTAGC